MQTIWKYPIQITDVQQIKFPGNTRPLYAGLDPSGIPCIWCQVDDQAVGRIEDVYVVGTGNPIPSAASLYIGSFVQGPFVWHVYV